MRAKDSSPDMFVMGQFFENAPLSQFGFAYFSDNFLFFSGLHKKLIHRLEISLKYLDLGWDGGKACCRTGKREESVTLLSVIRKNRLGILQIIKEQKMN